MVFCYFTDFPEASKLVLFMVTTWPTLLSHDSLLGRAVNVVSKLKADEEILDYLSKYLHWEEVNRRFFCSTLFLTNRSEQNGKYNVSNIVKTLFSAQYQDVSNAQKLT